MNSNHNYLIQKCYDGLDKRGLSNNSEAINRLNYELEIIKSGNLADFFLNTSYICLKLKEKGITMGNSRGSAGGSLVCYCLKITEINPLEFGLIFERFLNPTRINDISSADIDCDLEKSKRKYALQMIKDEFGHDRTYQIINKILFTQKSSIKDLARIIDIPFEVVNRITKLITDEDSIEDIPDVIDFLNKYPFIRDNYQKLIGLTKTYGIHAGGIITLDHSIEEYDSIVRVNGVDCIDNDGKSCDKLGYLKNDELGLRSLDIISDCLKLLPDVKIPRSYDDPAVYKNINESTTGLFQLESAAATEVCQKLRPTNFDELSSVLALCRPGPNDSGDTDLYIKRKYGEEPIKYDHPNLESILRQNYGTIVYQEDIMKIIIEFAGMTAVDADNIRRGISKKNQKTFDEYHPKFIDACFKQGIGNDTAEIVWQKMEASASYSFGKAHCYGYSTLTYAFAWLRTYFPIEFFLAVLNNTDDEDKRMKIYAEIRELNNDIVNPDINISKAITSTNYDGKVFLGFNLIKEVGESAVEKILKEQPYSSFNDFCDRCKVNIRVKKALIEAGTFDRFGQRRDELYSQLTGEDVHWDDKEMLFKEFTRIKINPSGNILDLFKLKDMGIDVEISSLNALKDNTEDYNDFYIKVLSSDFEVKDDYAYASVTDGFNSASIFVPKNFISRYIDDLNEVGNPLLCHVQGKGSKYSLLSLINLNDTEKSTKEWQWYNGEAKQKLQSLQESNPNVNVGLISNVKYFVSKKENNCAYYDVWVNDSIQLPQRIVCGEPPKMVEGSFIFFFVGDNPTFLDIIQVV